MRFGPAALRRLRHRLAHWLRLNEQRRCDWHTHNGHFAANCCTTCKAIDPRSVVNVTADCARNGVVDDYDRAVWTRVAVTVGRYVPR